MNTRGARLVDDLDDPWDDPWTPTFCWDTRTLESVESVDTHRKSWTPLFIDFVTGNPGNRGHPLFVDFVDLWTPTVHD